MTGRTDIVLLNMPFAPADRPSPGLHALAGCLKREGIAARILYPSAAYCDRLGEATYNVLGRRLGTHLVGEWVFSRHVHPCGPESAFITFLRERLDAEGIALDALLPPARLLDSVAAAGALLDAVVAEVGRLRPRLVGLGSSYHQHLACLAAAKRLKLADPGLFIVLGGANCNGEMGIETLRQFPFVDAVVAGPGEIALVELARSVLAGARPGPCDGVHLRDADGGVPDNLVPSVAPEPNLDAVPLPDFDDAFADPQARAQIKVIPFETSRGCWWGQKHHCVFCSENAESMRYRRKSPERVLAELSHLLGRYPGLRLHATDEILPLALIDTVMPRLASMPGPQNLFFSIKANIAKPQLAALAAAGVDIVQPGIESLDDDILGPMRKGISALRNVQTLKWCRELGIQVRWSLLFGFPFDTAPAYERTAAWAALLTHLDPPGLVPVSVQRFSPLFVEAARYGMTGMVPHAAYHHIYPFPDAVLARLAYRFDWRPPHTDALRDSLDRVKRTVAAWTRAAGCDALFSVDEDGVLFIGDSRGAATQPFHALSGLERAVCLACDGIRSEDGIRSDLASHGTAADPGAVRRAVRSLVDKRLLLEDKGLLLALPVRLRRSCLPPVPALAAFTAAKAAWRRTRHSGESAPGESQLRKEGGAAV